MSDKTPNAPTPEQIEKKNGSCMHYNEDCCKICPRAIAVRYSNADGGVKGGASP